jgi:hypothetical protein
VHGLRQTYHQLDLARLEIELILTQDRCTVCAEHTIGSEIILDAPDGKSLVAWVMWNLISVHLDTMLVSVDDRCMVCAKRTIGS